MKFYIWSHEDRTLGEYDSAVVDIDLDLSSLDKETIDNIKDNLRDTFSRIFDKASVSVMTETEYKIWEKMQPDE
jgi:hypothetical protein